MIFRGYTPTPGYVVIFVVPLSSGARTMPIFLNVCLGRRWIGEADKHDFQGMLTRDIIQSACGVPDF